MRIAVYTIIFGKYDSLKTYNLEYQKEADFFLITDDPPDPLMTDGYYRHIEIPVRERLRYMTRYYKINSHYLFFDYDYVIYLDGTTIMNTISPKQLIEKYLADADVAAFRYPDEDCTYIHAEKCKNVGRIEADKIDKHMEFYKQEGFPEHFGLCEMRVLIRKNTDEIKSLNELWWKTYNQYLTCDQLCFNYSLWKLGIKYNTFQFYYPDEPGDHEFKTLQSHNYFSPHKY